jgi:phosphate transport system protein
MTRALAWEGAGSMTRDVYEKQLTDLKGSWLTLGAMVSSALDRAVRALIERDLEGAQEVIRMDEEINKYQHAIEETCLHLIASQQPVARDLRLIFAISSTAWELERMADHATGIAKLAQRLAAEPMLKPLIDIPRMAQISRQMLQAQLDAFAQGDPDAARRAAERDAEVDTLEDQVFRELLVLMMTDPRTITRATYLMWVAHNLERFADRTTNIGERIIFLTSNEVVELNE